MTPVVVCGCCPTCAVQHTTLQQSLTYTAAVLLPLTLQRFVTSPGTLVDER